MSYNKYYDIARFNSICDQLINLPYKNENTIKDMLNFLKTHMKFTLAVSVIGIILFFKFYNSPLFPLYYLYYLLFLVCTMFIESINYNRNLNNRNKDYAKVEEILLKEISSETDMVNLRDCLLNYKEIYTLKLNELTEGYNSAWELLLAIAPLIIEYFQKDVMRQSLYYALYYPLFLLLLIVIRLYRNISISDMHMKLKTINELLIIIDKQYMFNKDR